MPPMAGSDNDDDDDDDEETADETSEDHAEEEAKRLRSFLHPRVKDNCVKLGETTAERRYIYDVYLSYDVDF
jgi:hypothetical protein